MLHHKHLSYVVHVVEVVVQNCGSERISSERIEWIDARIRGVGRPARLAAVLACVEINQ